MSDIKAYMLGPKAENLALFRQLVVEALDDHAYWRRNFHPEDNPAITNMDKSSPLFHQYEDRLRDLLFEFLADAKQGVPFFSARYIGHMNTDLLVPGLIGYFASMLYNQNNVAGESSPMTARLEREVVEMLARMIGFPIERPSASEDRINGYLTSGGTTANIYSLWIARNLRSWPLALRMACESPAEEHLSIAESIRDIRLALPDGGNCTLGDADPWALMNVPMQELYDLRPRLLRRIGRVDPGAYPDARRQGQVLEQFSMAHTLPHLGPCEFFRQAREMFPQDGTVLSGTWQVLASANKHYSWMKAMDLLGLGRVSLLDVNMTRDFVMDTADLAARLKKATDSRTPVLAVVAVSGATEEGSLDNLGAIHDAITTAAANGLSCWFHVDACYGGYLGSLIRTEEGAPRCTENELKTWLREFTSTHGVPPATADSLIDMSEHGNGWLSWGEFIDRVAALDRADSVSLDPHKLGYIPYPAGAVVVKSSASQDVISFDAPYLWAETRNAPKMFVGRYTLEGSRPGATAAACWLAHRSVPLSQQGHGMLLAASLLAARQLFDSLKRAAESSPDIGIAFINRPHMNMLCYIPYHRDSASLDEIQDVTRHVRETLDPTRKDHFMAVSTEVHVDLSFEEVEHLFTHEVAARIVPGRKRLHGKLDVIRSVVMGPLSLEASSRPDRTGKESVFDLFARALLETTDMVFQNRRHERLLESFRHHVPVLVVDDDPRVFDPIREAFWGHDASRIDGFLHSHTTVESALAVVNDDNHPLRFVFLDIDLGPDHPTGGYEIYEAICARNDRLEHRAFHVSHVIFLTIGFKDHEAVRNAIDRKHERPPRTYYVTKDLLPDRSNTLVKQVRKALLVDGFEA